MKHPLALGWLSLLLLPAGASAGGGYTLFSPTPREEMRELETDRPDRTEGPSTVDAGHLQVEADLVLSEYAKAAAGAPASHALSFLSFNARLGLLSNVEAGFVLQPFTYTRTRPAGGSWRSEPGAEWQFDAALRAKVNLWGNGGEEPTALAVLPYVLLPNPTRPFQGGLLLPLKVKLPEEFELGAMAQVDVLRDEGEAAHHWEVGGTLTVNREMIGELSGFAELFVMTRPGRGPSDATADFGFTYSLGEDAQADVAAYVPLSEKSDLTLTLGFTFRL